MFLKPFRIKTQTAIKGSDRKKLRAEVERQYPSLSKDDVTEMVPAKVEMTTMKIFTHSGESIVAYCLQKNPIFFQLHQTIFPTVYTLWKYPDLMPSLTTWPQVFPKLANGADLMLPGVIVKEKGSAAALGNLPKGAPCCIKFIGNRAPMAVGKTSVSSSDMIELGMRGKGLSILHIYQDHLWTHGDKSEPPLLEDPELLAISSDEFQNEDGESGEENQDEDLIESDLMASCSPSSCLAPTDELHQNEISRDETQAIDNSQSCSADIVAEVEAKTQDLDISYEASCADTSPDSMDELLYHCFMTALKVSVKKSDLPLLTSKFYRSHMLPTCPADKTLDVKKSNYKKLSKFLQAMQRRDLIKIKELSKGSESIVEIEKGHPEIRQFTVTEVAEDTSCKPEPEEAEYCPPQISEMFTLPSSVMPLFKLFGYQKGTALTAPDARRVITDYVKTNELQDTTNKSQVTVDIVLGQVVLNKNENYTSLRWEEVFSRCIAKLNPAYQITLPGQKPEVRKGKLDPISLTVAQRGGNKKVTLIHNLETFGIDMHEFAQRVRLGVACSTSISSLPGKHQGMEVLVQGNQIKFVTRLLTDKYKLASKYIESFDKFAKGGKKGS